MSDDLDYRVETLCVGDELRWLGTWHEVMGGQVVGRKMYLRLLDRASGTWRSVLYTLGTWVAARPTMREDAA